MRLKGDLADPKGVAYRAITNHTGLDSEGRTLDLLGKARGYGSLRSYSPRAWLYGDADAKIASHRDRATGLDRADQSLRRPIRRPTPEMFAGLDAIVF